MSMPIIPCFVLTRQTPVYIKVIGVYMDRLDACTKMESDYNDILWRLRSETNHTYEENFAVIEMVKAPEKSRVEWHIHEKTLYWSSQDLQAT